MFVCMCMCVCTCTYTHICLHLCVKARVLLLFSIAPHSVYNRVSPEPGSHWLTRWKLAFLVLSLQTCASAWLFVGVWGVSKLKSTGLYICLLFIEWTISQAYKSFFFNSENRDIGGKLNSLVFLILLVTIQRCNFCKHMCNF